MPETNESPIGKADVLTEKKVDFPQLFRVILHNDDYTSMDFVVEVLKTVFNKPVTEATRIMLLVHRSGQAVCGVFTRDIAFTKANEVQKYARKRGFPLRCSVEEAE